MPYGAGLFHGQMQTHSLTTTYPHVILSAVLLYLNNLRKFAQVGSLLPAWVVKNFLGGESAEVMDIGTRRSGPPSVP